MFPVEDGDIECRMGPLDLKLGSLHFDVHDVKSLYMLITESIFTFLIIYRNPDLAWPK